MERILLVEDDAALAHGIALALNADEREMVIAESAAGARQKRAEGAFQLVILDINLPDASGLDLLRQWRAAGDTVPVILLTANDLEMDEVIGLEAGANDYITKPFSLAVLRARVAVQLRNQPASPAQVVALGPFRFDFARMVFLRGEDEVTLSKTEQKLLHVLVDNRGHAVRRETLIDRVWGDTAYVEENALSVTVKRLRAKLEDDPAHPVWLRTIYGIGYLWAVAP